MTTEGHTTTQASIASSVTDVQKGSAPVDSTRTDNADNLQRTVSQSHYVGESALPEDKKEEAYENAEDDWLHDERNPRNWTWGKKWTAVLIVSLYTFVSPLSACIFQLYLGPCNKL